MPKVHQIREKLLNIEKLESLYKWLSRVKLPTPQDEAKASELGQVLYELIEKNRKPIPACCVCGTTENLWKDGWNGYRCRSVDCVSF